MRPNEIELAPGMRTGARCTIVGWTCAIIAWLFGAALFFRALWMSGFETLSGDFGDGRVTIYLREHLFNWLQGTASFASPAFFFPVPNVLGHSDAYLLDLLPYTLLRVAGAAPFLSGQLTLILLTLLGYITFIGFVRFAFDVRYSLAIVCALLFVFSNNIFLEQMHASLFAVNYVPAIAWLTLWSLRDFPRLSARLIGGVIVASALYGLLFSTGYYTAWNVGLVILLAAIPTVLLAHKQLLLFLLAHARRLLLLAFLAVVAFAIGLIPFAIIYGPLIESGATYGGFGAAILGAPFPQDIINVGPWNLVWGALLARIAEGQTVFRWGIVVTSITPVVTIATLVGAWYVWRGRLIDRMSEPHTATFAIVVSFVFWMAWLLTWRIGKYSGYWLIWHLVPGASGIRVPGRVGLIVNIAMLAALALMLDRLLASCASLGLRAAALTKILVLALLACCLIEQINTYPVAQIQRSRQLQELAAVPRPPDRCDVFFVEPATPAEFDAAQTSAMLISQRYGLPTINGGSGYFPPDWPLLRYDSSYHARIRQWMALKGLRGGMCSLNLPRGPWQPF